MAEVSLPAGLDEIRDKAFYNCQALKKINFADAAELKLIGNEAFYSCRALPEALIPNSVSYLGHSAFAYNYALAKVNIPEVKTISHSTFQACIALTDVYIPESVKTIEKFAFMDCSHLTNLTGRENVETYGESCFARTNLHLDSRAAIEFSASTRSIDEKAFEGLPLEEVIVHMDTPIAINENTFNSDVYETATLIVPKGAKELYKTAATWSLFKNIVGEDEDLNEPNEDEEIEVNGINEITNSDASVQNRYGLNGQMTNGKGLNIIRMSNGQVRKVMVK